MYKFVRSNLTVVLLGLLTLLVVALPLIKTTFNGVFYIVDPDAVYVGNAISYIKVGQISYLDHPGTPSIQLLATAMVPVRLYSKFIKKQSFLTTVVEHYKFIFAYLRLFQAAIFTLGIVVFLYSIKSFTKTSVSAFFGWIYLMSFSALPYFALSISAEALNIFILSLWSSLLLVFAKHKSPIVLVFLCFVAGFALSNRLTNFFIVISSLGLTSYLLLSTVFKLRNLLINFVFIVCGFLIGTAPIATKYSVLFGWVVRLATTPKLHGGGQGFFSLTEYISSLTTVINTNLEVLFVGVLVAVLMLIVYVKKRVFGIEMLLMFVATVGIIIFSKYPLAHYQTANIFLLVTSMIIFIDRYNKRFAYVAISLILLAFVLPKNLNSYYKNIGMAIDESKIIDQNAKEQSSDSVITLWEWSISRDFSLLWGDSWTGNGYQPELGIIRPNLYQLGMDMKSYRTASGQFMPLFGVCWRNLFIQTSELDRFLKTNAEHAFTIRKIHNTRMSVVTSNHCSTKP